MVFCAKCKTSILQFPDNPVLKIGDYFQPAKSLLFEKDESLFNYGEKANGVFCIYSGAVKIVKPGALKHPIIIYNNPSGEIIGFNSIKEGRYIYSAMAIDKTHACFIQLTEIGLFLKGLSTLTQKILHNKY